MPFDLSILSALNPSAGEIASLFTGLSKVPAPILKAILSGLDEHVLDKIGQWSSTFIQHVNDLGGPAIDPAVMAASLKPGSADDFFTVMGSAQHVGPTLNTTDLDAASNAITKAIKSADWEQAIQIGLSLAKVIPV